MLHRSACDGKDQRARGPGEYLWDRRDWKISPLPCRKETLALRPRRSLRHIASFNLAEGPNQVSRQNGKWLVAVTAEVRGRDIGSLVDEAQAKVVQRVILPPDYWLGWGGQFENSWPRGNGL
jgi:Cu/Ag efflux pump CusA